LAGLIGTATTTSRQNSHASDCRGKLEMPPIDDGHRLPFFLFDEDLIEKVQPSVDVSAEGIRRH